MLMNVIGGRVAPSFLKNKYPDLNLTNYKLVLPLSMISIVAMMICIIGEAPQYITGTFSGLAALLITLRLWGWKGWVALSDPLMVILHIGILWIAIGFYIMTYANFVDDSYIILSYHALSVGAAGSLTLGMMSRAIIGHSGLPMNNEFIITSILCLVNLAAITRIIAPIFFVDQYTMLLSISGICWVLAYLLFLIRFVPTVIKAKSLGL